MFSPVECFSTLPPLLAERTFAQLVQITHMQHANMPMLRQSIDTPPPLFPLSFPTRREVQTPLTPE